MCRSPSPLVLAAKRKYGKWNSMFRNGAPEPIPFGKTWQEFIKCLKSEPLLKGIPTGKRGGQYGIIRP